MAPVLIREQEKKMLPKANNANIVIELSVMEVNAQKRRRIFDAHIVNNLPTLCVGGGGGGWRAHPIPSPSHWILTHFVHVHPNFVTHVYQSLLHLYHDLFGGWAAWIAYHDVFLTRSLPLWCHVELGLLDPLHGLYQWKLETNYSRYEIGSKRYVYLVSCESEIIAF